MPRKLQERLQQFPPFLWLLPIFFIHTGYNELFGLLPISLVLKNLIILGVAIWLILLPAHLYFRDLRKAALYTFIISLSILFFGYFHDLLKKSPLPHLFTKYTVITALLLLFYVIAARRIKKSSHSFYKTYRYLNVLMLMFLIFETGRSITAYATMQKDKNLLDPRFSVYNALHQNTTADDTGNPDIYLIVFDEMPSSLGLKKYFGKDNTALDDSLSRDGFYVIKNARSNYFHTVYALASVFNMEYLPNSKSLVRTVPSYLTCIESLSNNSLISFLRSKNYAIQHYQPLSFPPVQNAFTSHFNILRTAHFFYKTLPGRLYRDLYWNLYRTQIPFVDNILFQQKRNLQKKRVRDLLQTTTLIKNSCSADGPPKFVFGHYILPHAPYTFNREGEVIPSEPGDPFDKKTNRLEAYFEQVLYANKIIAELVSHIKKNNKKNTIIMIMGDHGYRDDTDQSQTDAAFYNFNAVYFPDGNYQHMNDSLTSVNTFRTVLNVGFNTKLPILKDSFFRMLQTTSAY